MNIFVSDSDAWVSARALDDKRVGKLLMESNQMMSLAIKTTLPEEEWCFDVGDGCLTRGWAHLNHPCSIWARSSEQNFDWLFEHATALRAEFHYRFGNYHGSGERTLFIGNEFGPKRMSLPALGLLPFQNSARNDGLGIDYTHLPVPISYREYLKHRWATDTKPVTWTRRGPPEWLE